MGFERFMSKLKHGSIKKNKSFKVDNHQTIELVMVIDDNKERHLSGKLLILLT